MMLLLGHRKWWLLLLEVVRFGGSDTLYIVRSKTPLESEANDHLFHSSTPYQSQSSRSRHRSWYLSPLSPRHIQQKHSRLTRCKDCWGFVVRSELVGKTERAE